MADSFKKDGWPAKIARSLSLGSLSPIMGRFRNRRDGALQEEQMDILRLNENSELKVESPRPVEVVLEEMLVVLGEIRDRLNDMH